MYLNLGNCSTAGRFPLPLILGHVSKCPWQDPEPSEPKMQLPIHMKFE